MHYCNSPYFPLLYKNKFERPCTAAAGRAAGGATGAGGRLAVVLILRASTTPWYAAGVEEGTGSALSTQVNKSPALSAISPQPSAS